MSEPLIPEVTYLSLADADALADALPELAAFKAASDQEKSAAILLASMDIDSAMPYQGDRYDADQHLEFPRDFAGDADPAHVWDWDVDEGVAVVPARVKRATLYQADSILEAAREPRLAAQHDGVVYEQSDESAESYKATPGSGVPTGLCRRAWVVMRRYRLQGGRLL